MTAAVTPTTDDIIRPDRRTLSFTLIVLVSAVTLMTIGSGLAAASIWSDKSDVDLSLYERLLVSAVIWIGTPTTLAFVVAEFANRCVLWVAFSHNGATYRLLLREYKISSEDVTASIWSYTVESRQIFIVTPDGNHLLSDLAWSREQFSKLKRAYIEWRRQAGAARPLQSDNADFVGGSKEKDIIRTTRTDWQLHLPPLFALLMAFSFIANLLMYSGSRPKGEGQVRIRCLTDSDGRVGSCQVQSERRQAVVWPPAR